MSDLVDDGQRRRLECLRLASSLMHRGPAEVIDAAKELDKYIFGNGPDKPATAPATGKAPSAAGTATGKKLAPK